MLKTRLNLECLEGRVVPSAAAMPRIQEINQSVVKQDILPNQNDVPLARFSVGVSGSGVARFAHPDDFTFLPMLGSEWLADNTNEFILKADLNPKVKGYETIVGYGQADLFTDKVDIHVTPFTSKPLWITAGTPLNLELDADFNMFLTGDQIGVQLAEVDCSTLSGVAVPQDHVSYWGARPVMHKMESNIFFVSQIPMVPSASVPAGNGVTLLQFDAFSTTNVKASFSFTTVAGTLKNGNDYQLVHTNIYGYTDDWIFDYTVTTNILGNSILTFSFNFVPSLDDGTWSLEANIAPSAPSGSKLQMAFWAIAATSNNKSLKGFVDNGVGAGQVQLWHDPNMATLYTVM